MEKTVVHLRAVGRVYQMDGSPTEAVRAASFMVAKGEFVGLVGPSGCGKSTLLNIVGLVDSPTSGEVFLGGDRVNYSSEQQLVALRRKRLGYIFQQFNLIPTMTALENVMVPLLLNEVPGDPTEMATTILASMGLAGKVDSFPSELSGGEMQRVACARAVVHQPDIVIADEPTGNLDSKSGERVLDLLKNLAQNGTAILMATHSDAALGYCSRAIRMRDGAIVT